MDVTTGTQIWTYSPTLASKCGNCGWHHVVESYVYAYKCPSCGYLVEVIYCDLTTLPVNTEPVDTWHDEEKAI